MTTLEAPPAQRLSLRRRVIGAVIVIMLLADIGIYTVAQLDPHNVFLRSHFYNFVTAIGIVLAGVSVGSVVLFPIRNSAVQNVRPFVRLGLFAVTVLVLIAAAFINGFGIITYQVHYVAATSPDGKLSAVMVSTNGKWDELHILSGSGLGRKDLGDIGAPCAADRIFFVGDTSLTITSTNDTSVSIPLDPQTGAPLQVLQLTCAFETTD